MTIKYPRSCDKSSDFFNLDSSSVKMSRTPPVRIGRLQVLRESDITEQNDESLQKLYIWIDEIPLSKPKKSLARDFSDGGIFFVVIIQVTMFYDL